MDDDTKSIIRKLEERVDILEELGRLRADAARADRATMGNILSWIEDRNPVIRRLLEESKLRNAPMAIPWPNQKRGTA